MRSAIIALLSVLASQTTSAPDVPAVFSDLSHDAAVERAREQNKLLLINFTAAWFVPCQRMNQTTWADERVGGWISENALAIQLDVDEHNDFRSAYRVHVMPTIVLLRDGEEVDRIAGYRNAEELIAWLDGARDGRTELDALRNAGEGDVEARYDLARTLVMNGEDDEASGHLVWLWERSMEHRPSFAGVRSGSVARTIETLAKRHHATLVAFDAIFERLQEEIESGSLNDRTWLDWVTLCTIVNREADVVRWLEDHCSTAEALPQAPVLLFDRLTELLVEQGRLDIAGCILPDVVALARGKVAQQESHRSAIVSRVEEPGWYSEMVARQLRDELLLYQRIAFAAGRLEQAEEVEQAMLDALDDSDTRMMIVRQALEAGQARTRHVRIAAEVLARAENGGDGILAEGLLERLEVALSSRAEDSPGSSNPDPAAARSASAPSPRPMLARPVPDRRVAQVSREDPPEGLYDDIWDEFVDHRPTDGNLLIVEFQPDGPADPESRWGKQLTNWSDAGLSKWMSNHVMFDTQVASRRPEWTAALGLISLPAVVALRAPDRIVTTTGPREPALLQAWVSDVAAERIPIERGDPTSNDFNWRPAFSESKRLLEQGRGEEAVEHLLWMWEAHRAKIRYVRNSWVAGVIRDYAPKSQPVRESFRQIFYECQEQLELGSDDPDTWNDWITLGPVLDLEDDMLAFVHSFADGRGRLPRAPPRDIDDLFEALAFAGHCREAGLLLENIAIKARKDVEFHRQMDQRHGGGWPDEARAGVASRLRWELGSFYAAAVAASRPEQATAVAQAALGIFDDSEMRLRMAHWSAWAGHPTSEARRFLEEAKAALEGHQCRDSTGQQCSHLALLSEAAQLFEQEH